MNHNDYFNSLKSDSNFREIQSEKEEENHNKFEGQIKKETKNTYINKISSQIKQQICNKWKKKLEKNQFKQNLQIKSLEMDLVFIWKKNQQKIESLVGIVERERKFTQGQFEKYFGVEMDEEDSLDLYQFMIENNNCNTLDIDIQQIYHLNNKLKLFQRRNYESDEQKQQQNKDI